MMDHGSARHVVQVKMYKSSIVFVFDPQRSEFLNRVEPCSSRVTCFSRIFVYHSSRLVIFLVVDLEI